MTEADDIELLRQFARENSEEAFAAIVTRHVNLVYSVALRQVGNSHSAEEITQAVFIILARKSKKISSKTILTGWLHQTTRLTAANFLRTEIRRQNREQEAFMQSTFSETNAETWTQIAPLLDDAISKLGGRDRDAILLRYFENKSAREMAAALRVDEPAAQKRVTRAVEKLRTFFAKRGVTLTAAAIAGAVSANSVQAAPVGLAAALTAAAAKGAAVSASTLTLIKGALKIMAWTKMKTAIVAGVVVLLAAGTTTVILKQTIQPTIEDSFFKTDYDSLRKVPQNILIIRPTHFAKTDGGGSYWLYSPVNRAVGRNVSLKEMLGSVYDFSSSRMVLPANLPKGNFDYLITKSSDVKEEFQNQLEKQFGLVGRKEMLETDGLLLKLKTPNAPKLNPSTGRNGWTGRNAGEFSGTNMPISTLAGFAEGIFHLPVLDQTGLTNNFDFKLTWDEYGKKRGDYPNLQGLKQALLDQLGLELVPTNMPIEMLVVEKVKN